MLNSYSNTKVNISAVSGTICKTHVKSFIISCNMQSGTAEELLSTNPCVYLDGQWERAVVLQCMNANDNYIIAEVIKQSDYEEALQNDTNT